MNPREKLFELARERGNSLAALSRMLGRNSSYLQQYITKGSPRKLEEIDRRRLAQFFGVGEAELGGPEEISYAPQGDGSKYRACRSMLPPGRARSARPKSRSTLSASRAAGCANRGSSRPAVVDPGARRFDGPAAARRRRDLRRPHPARRFARASMSSASARRSTSSCSRPSPPTASA